MATYTTNLNLKKPEQSDKIRIADINGNMESVDAAFGAVGTESVAAQIGAVQDGIAIVANGNTHGAITAGQFVFVKNHNTLDTGLYVASSNISANATLSNTNLTADSAGGLNAIHSRLESMLTRTSISDFSENNDTWTATASGIVTVISSQSVTGVWYVYAFEIEGSTVSIGGMGGTSGTAGITHSFTFPVHKGYTYKLLMSGITSVTTRLYPI